MIKTRFAPSPTGHMHVGNLRTALFNFLYARKFNGSFLLRIEDTDQTRSETIYEKSLLDDLKWLGVDIDEGPFYQSKRQEIYDGYYKKLVNEKFAYPCFCSDAALALSRKMQLASGKPPRYSGICRNLTEDEVLKKTSQGEKPSLRFHVANGFNIEFEDAIKGSQKFLSDDIGDFIIRRSDGTASFMFCNAIDDSLMDVTHALRGDDHLTNTPRQILILEALKLRVPTYGHFPMINGSDGKKLSKRNGNKSVGELKNAGFLPEAILNQLSRLGHNYTNNALMTTNQLAEHFDLSCISNSPAQFDEGALLHWQKESILHMSNIEFAAYIKHYLSESISDDKLLDFANLIHSNITFGTGANIWYEIFVKKEFNYGSHGAILSATPEGFFESLINYWIENKSMDLEELYKKSLEHQKSTFNVAGKKLFMPVRIALTGMVEGPELPKIIKFLGHLECLELFERAKNYVKTQTV